jgi:hypothetical protein
MKYWQDDHSQDLFFEKMSRLKMLYVSVTVV